MGGGSAESGTMCLSGDRHAPPRTQVRSRDAAWTWRTDAGGSAIVRCAKVQVGGQPRRAPPQRGRPAALASPWSGVRGSRDARLLRVGTACCTCTRAKKQQGISVNTTAPRARCHAARPGPRHAPCQPRAPGIAAGAVHGLPADGRRRRGAATRRHKGAPRRFVF
jgi:hypothetical protein